MLYIILKHNFHIMEVSILRNLGRALPVKLLTPEI
jgi:hypothetical protein